MPYIPQQNRDQIMMCSLDSLVAPESIVRIIDVFTASLDLVTLGFTKSTAASEGRPAYDPRILLGLYIYGYRKTIRSSRKLEEACRVNIEVKWLMGGLEPDFRTISDFRKDNADHLKSVFHEFNKRLVAIELPTGFISIDGSKFQAWNAKDANFTANKLDDRIAWLNQHTDEYLRLLESIDEMEESEAEGMLTREEVQAKLVEAKERLERYIAYRRYMEENGLTQLSVTDADSRLMKSKNGFIVAYNVQTAIDSETHLIRDFQVTNHVTDHGLLESTAAPLHEESEILDLTADKGYDKAEDMIRCLEQGIVPHVILPDGQDTYEFEIEYLEGEADLSSKQAEDLNRALHAGKIPEVYQDVISKTEVIKKKTWVSDEQESGDTEQSIYGTEEEMKARAAEGYFVRDPERNIVYCPAQETLRQKSIKKNGMIRYANRAACRRCPYRDQCFKGKLEWKEIDFSKDTLEIPNRHWLKKSEKSLPKKSRGNGHFETIKIVRLTFKPKRALMEKRMCLSEHPFGTIKRSLEADYFLLCGLMKTTAEFALFGLGYNLQRALNLLGFKELMRAMAYTI